MRRPKASFVVPVFNEQRFLAPAIESCLRQTEKNIEVVVVNDGSTDHTRKVIDVYLAKDARVRCLDLEHNAGRSRARNAGIGMATGDVILTLDADDMALPHRAAWTLGYLKKNPGVDIVYGVFQLIDVLGGIRGQVEAVPFDWKRVQETKFTYIGHSTMAFRKDVFKAVRYTDGEFCKLGIDDWKFQVDAHKKGFRFAALNKLLSQYRVIEKARDEKRILELKNECLQ